MNFKAMIVGGALMLAAGSVVAFAGEDHAKTVTIEDADDDVADAKVKVKSDKRHKLSESDFKKVAVKDDKVKTFDEAAFRDDDECVATPDDDDDDDDSNGSGKSGDASCDSGASGPSGSVDDTGVDDIDDDDGIDDDDESGHGDSGDEGNSGGDDDSGHGSGDDDSN